MSDQATFQQRLASRVVIVGTVVVGSCAAIAIAATPFGGKETAAAAKDILTLLLPVVGTWIGTVLAFYFSRENFEAAARETRLSLQQRLSVPAISIAIPVSRIKAMEAADLAAAKLLTLQDVRAHLATIGFLRTPIFSPQKAPLLVVHSQPVDAVIASKAAANQSVAGLTVADLMAASQTPTVVQSFALIGETATLSDAKAAMESQSGCQDVFITKTGRAGESVIGWLTNNEIQRAATA